MSFAVNKHAWIIQKIVPKIVPKLPEKEVYQFYGPAMTYFLGSSPKRVSQWETSVALPHANCEHEKRRTGRSAIAGSALN